MTWQSFSHPTKKLNRIFRGCFFCSYRRTLYAHYYICRSSYIMSFPQTAGVRISAVSNCFHLLRLPRYLQATILSLSASASFVRHSSELGRLNGCWWALRYIAVCSGVVKEAWCLPSDISELPQRVGYIVEVVLEVSHQHLTDCSGRVKTCGRICNREEASV